MKSASVRRNSSSLQESKYQTMWQAASRVFYCSTLALTLEQAPQSVHAASSVCVYWTLLALSHMHAHGHDDVNLIQPLLRQSDKRLSRVPRMR